MHPARLPPDELLLACRVVRTRRSGPGGQHRNKVATAVVVTHVESGIRAEASERRSQKVNLGEAVFRLRVRLAVRVRTPFAGKPTPTWESRRRGTRLTISAEHADFPALLSEAFDALAAAEWDPARAAESLGVTATQLVRLARLHGEAWAELNRARQARGLRPLT